MLGFLKPKPPALEPRIEQAFRTGLYWVMQREFDKADACAASVGRTGEELFAWMQTTTLPPLPPAQSVAVPSTGETAAVRLPAWADPVGDPGRIHAAVMAKTGKTIQTIVRTDDGWLAVLGEPSSRPDAREHRLEASVKPTDGERLSASLRQSCRQLIAFDPYGLRMVSGVLEPAVDQLRTRIAAMLGTSVRPWDIELSVTWKATADGQTAEPAVLHVERMPAIPDAEKRRQTWIQICNQLLPCPVNTNWWVEDESHAGRLTVRRAEDPLGAIQVYPWDAPVTYKSIPFAVDVAGDLVSLGLLESNLLIGGTPGSGKSGGATALLCGIARLPHVALIGLDPKRVELAPWKPRFSRIATREEDATVVLELLVEEMERRYEYLEEAGLKKFSEKELTDERPLIVLHVDELADLVAVGVTPEEKKTEGVRASRIQRLIAKGRAAGIVIITATQKPQSTVVPTTLRDLIQQRVGYATTTPDMSDTILGSGMSRNGGLCHEIPSSLRGVCFIVNESSRNPVRARTFWVPDEEVAAIAQSVAHLRIELPWLAPAAPGVNGIPGAKAVSLDDLFGNMQDFEPVEISLDDLETETGSTQGEDDLWG